MRLIGALLAALALAGCGGSSPVRPEPDRPDPGPIRMAMAGVGTLDPARAVTAQETELDWVLYTGLVTYRHAGGAAGTELIPGVARTMPRVGDGGRDYTLTLRRGTRFCGGPALRASDVVATFERVLRTSGSPARPLLLRVLRGAAAFASGRARTITGLVGDGNASGRVTIRLDRPDPAFDALLAEPALGIVPAGTPVRDRPGHPPVGIGPYCLRHVLAGRSFALVRNRRWHALPGIPAGQVDVEVTLSSAVSADARAVLNDVLDVEDPVQALPARTLAELLRHGRGRDPLVLDGRPVAYVFLGDSRPPFDNRLAREGVLDGLGAQGPGGAASRTVPAACDVVPLVAAEPAPDGCGVPALAVGQLTAARALVARSGTRGEPITVWAPRSGPEGGWLRAQASVLRSLGYPVRIATLPDATYRRQIAALVPPPLAPRPGGAARNPSGMRPALARSAELVRTPVAAIVDGAVAATVRAAIRDPLVVAIGPRTTLAQARRARRLEVAEPAVRELMSWRMDEDAAVIDPVEGLDFTSLRLR